MAPKWRQKVQFILDRMCWVGAGFPYLPGPAVARTDESAAAPPPDKQPNCRRLRRLHTTQPHRANQAEGKSQEKKRREQVLHA